MTISHDTSGYPSPRRLWIAFLAVAVFLLWVNWPSLRDMVVRWSRDPRYSHGFLVPAFSLFLLWQRRELAEFAAWRTSWWGVALLAAGEGVRLLGARYYVDWAQAISLLPSLAGVALLAGGWKALRWAWPAILFLFFMIPLPYRVEYALGYPLQRMATLSSNYLLQALGQASVAEGNVILLGGGPKQTVTRIGVVEACNGLGMLLMFLAYATAAVMMLRRSLFDKVVILLSAVPIAVAANVTRITVTGLLHETTSSRVANAVYHDLAGWLMMPLALAALWLECFLLSRLFIDVVEDEPMVTRLLLSSKARKVTSGSRSV